MEIICPECKFTRVVDETKIPARSQVATCPKCQTKFQFRELPEEAPVEPAPEVAPQVEEDVQIEPAPQQPLQGTLPVDEEPVHTPEERAEEEPTFPKISAPGEDPKEGLWDKLNDMAPPEESRKEAPIPPPAAPRYEEPAMDNHAEEKEPVPGWTGQFNEEFPDPMQDEMNDDDEKSSPLVPPPFEQLDRYGFFPGLYMTVKLILTSPRLFFSVMPVGGGLSKPLTFTILLTMIQGFVQYFWGLVGLSVSVGPEGSDAISGVSNTLAPVMMLLFMPAFIAAGQFIITGIYHLLLILMRADSKGFEGTFRALAYANAPIIVGLFPMPVEMIEITWMGVAAIWGLFLTITGLKHIHKTSYAKVIPVALIPLLLAMIAGLAIIQGAVPTI